MDFLSSTTQAGVPPWTAEEDGAYWPDWSDTVLTLTMGRPVSCTDTVLAPDLDCMVPSEVVVPIGKCTAASFVCILLTCTCVLSGGLSCVVCVVEHPPMFCLVSCPYIVGTSILGSLVSFTVSLVALALGSEISDSDTEEISVLGFMESGRGTIVITVPG